MGGRFKSKKTVFEALDELGIKVPEKDRYDRFFSVFDFEAMTAKTANGAMEQGKTLHGSLPLGLWNRFFTFIIEKQIYGEYPLNRGIHTSTTKQQPHIRLFLALGRTNISKRI